MKRAELQRDRTRKVNQALLNRRWRHEKKRGENYPKGISAFKRITKFPGQLRKPWCGKLCCGACCELLPMNLTTITKHIGTRKLDWDRKAQHKESRTKNVAMAEAPSSDFRKHHVGKCCLRRSTYCVKVIENCLNPVQALLGWHVCLRFCVHWPGIAKLNKRWTPGITFGTAAVYFMDSSPFPWERERERERGGGGVHDKGHLCRQGCLYDV